MENNDKRKVIDEFLSFCKNKKIYLMNMKDRLGQDFEFINELKIEDEFLGEDWSKL